MMHFLSDPFTDDRSGTRLLAALLLCATLAACAHAPVVEPQRPALIPAPASLSIETGAFTIASNTPIVVAASDAEARRVADYLSDLTARTRGIAFPVRGEGRGIELRRVADPNLGAEAYRLIVRPNGVIIEARETAGLFYGATTLWQLLTEDSATTTDRRRPRRRDASSVIADSTASEGAGGPISIPALRIEDAPRFSWRGLMLDSARHYQSPEFIRALIDVMALHKLNVLHWHLTDDQAWRIEIRRYPRLTEIGAWRVPAGAGASDIDPATGRPRLYGGFYSQEEIRSLVAYAAARNVAIAPEIEMPGHATAAIVAYPQLGVGWADRAPSGAHPDAAAQGGPEGPRSVPADWGIYQNLFNVEESTFTFLENVLLEVMELFPSRYIHVGGDEAVKRQWENSARVQARMRELGIADERALQSYFIQRMERFLSAHGRRLIGWDEILEGGLAPNATVMSWRGIDGAVAAARAGHDAVLAAWPILYFDNRQSASPNEPPGRGRVVSVRDVYSFDTTPEALSAEEQRHMLGVQANIWTEHIRTENRVWRMAFPRAAAVAELGWSAPEHISWDDFARRLPVQEMRYHLLGMPAPPQPAPPLDPRRRVSQELETCADKLVLSLEDDAPVRGERAIFLIDIMQPCWIWRGADLSGVRTIAAAIGQVPFNFQIGDDVRAIAFREPATPEGELEVRLGCEGERIAALPLRPAAANPAVTILPPALLAPRDGVYDLCFTFTARGVDPMYALDWVALDRRPLAGEQIPTSGEP